MLLAHVVVTHVSIFNRTITILHSVPYKSLNSQHEFSECFNSHCPWWRRY